MQAVTEHQSQSDQRKYLHLIYIALYFFTNRTGGGKGLPSEMNMLVLASVVGNIRGVLKVQSNFAISSDILCSDLQHVDAMDMFRFVSWLPAAFQATGSDKSDA